MSKEKLTVDPSEMNAALLDILPKAVLSGLDRAAARAQRAIRRGSKERREWSRLATAGVKLALVIHNGGPGVLQTDILIKGTATQAYAQLIADALLPKDLLQALKNADSRLYAQTLESWRGNISVENLTTGYA